MLAEEGNTVVKVFLHLCKDEQRKRLEARLDDPAKRWKFRLDDLENRGRWDDYLRRYEDAITRHLDAVAPVVRRPADHKWASGLAVASSSRRPSKP